MPRKRPVSGWNPGRTTPLQWFILSQARDGKDIYEGCWTNSLTGSRQNSINSLIGRELLGIDRKITEKGLAMFQPFPAIKSRIVEPKQ